MKYQRLSWGIVCLFLISFASCEKEITEPNYEQQVTVITDSLPPDSTIVTNTGGGNISSGGSSGTSSWGQMEVMNGLYFGTYNGGSVPNVSSIDSVYADVDSIGLTGYYVKIYSDRRLSDKITEFKVCFQTLDFMPCDIGVPSVYSESWNGCDYFDETRSLEVLNCNSINLSIGTYGSGRGGCPSFNIFGFVGDRLL